MRLRPDRVRSSVPRTLSRRSRSCDASRPIDRVHPVTTPPPPGDRRRRPGQLEAQVITVLGSAATPLTPGEVRDLLDPSGALSYSAVVTTLTRLHEKGSVTRHRDGRAFRYGALSDAAGL